MNAVQIPNKASLLCNAKLVVTEDKPRWVTPSVFTQEMLQSTEERLANTAEVHQPRIQEFLGMDTTTYHSFSLVDVHQPLFQPYPSELIFQNFAPAQTYKLPLLLLNNDKVSRQVTLQQQDSEYFCVVGPEDPGRKVAPGLPATYTVSFTPQENKDYEHTIVCVTERERFEIPIRAIGPRAILDFRDEIHLPVCPVKSCTEKTHLVRNMGNSEAKFELRTQRPFSVTPSSGALDVGESMQVTVVFHPMSTGDHRQDLLLHYHTGEDVYISLYGSCEELDIRLVPDSVWLTDTYISLANVHKVSLTNNSDTVLQYCWTVSASQQEEDLSLLRESSVLQQKEEDEEEEEGRERPVFQCDFDPVLHYLPLLSRALQECRTQAAKDCLLTLSHSCIAVDPVEGEIWPGTTANFLIVFKPEEAKLYQQTIYCDITGRESRLPLTIQGEGLGPNVQFDYNLINVGNVFIGDKNQYEVQVSNRGLIDAPFKLSSPDTTFGRCFSFSPEEGVVPPGACQIVKVTFHSRILGAFSEDLLLTVTGQPQPLTLTFRGSVVVPTFHLNVSELSFGDVPFGFPQTLSCTLFNTSFVPMTFALRVLGDGLGSPSVSAAKQVSEASRKTWQGHTARDLHALPAEFTVSPASNFVRAMSDVTFKVTLCSNTVKRYRLGLTVDVEGVGKEILTLPINARCVVPEIMVEPSVLDFQRCFLDHPYKQSVQLTNPSNMAACYGVLDQEYEESPSLVFGSSEPRGVIPPGASLELPVFLLAKAAGKLHHTLRIAVFGSLQPPMEVVLSCIGQGAVVHVQSAQLQFGRIPVLTDVVRTLQLINQSPVPAHFTARMSSAKSFWRVEPSEGEVPPDDQLELKVVAHLKDTLQFQNTLEVSIQDSRTLAVRLSATGTGTTIVSDEPLGPSLDLGTHFSHEPCEYHFKLTNSGQRRHLIYWKNSGFPSSSKTRKGDTSPGRTFLPPIPTPRQRGGLNRGSLISSSREKPMFSLSPTRVELFPGDSVNMVLKGCSDSPMVVRERLVCQAIIGAQGSYEQIMSVDITCRFVAPVLSISSKELNFYLQKDKGKHLLPVYEKLVLKNVSCLPRSVELSLVEPFSLCEASGDHSSFTAKSMIVGAKSQTELWICFNPACYSDQMSRTVDEFLDVRFPGHQQEDVVNLHAEVHFPNLDFSSTTVDFGCVFNCTATRKVITITNCSPLPVSYRWGFLDDQKYNNIRETEMLVEEKMLRNPENEAEEWQVSSGTLSPACSAPVSCRPSTDERVGAQRPVRVEEVFDILPMFGHLQPGDQQQVTFYFYGHENTSREVVAQCHVEDGPTYEVKLRGEASVISYSLDSTHLDFGLQLFQLVGEAEVTLRNTGKVGFKFSMHPRNGSKEEADEESGDKLKAWEEEEQQREDRELNEKEQEVRPGRPTVVPAVGYIDAGKEQRLRVLYLPGFPEVFEKLLQLQVAFLPPQDVTLSGVGVFPRISLNLPRNLSDECSSDVVQQARAAVEADRVREELMDGITAGGGATIEATCAFTYEELLHMEIERLLVKENALAVSGSLLELGDSQGFSAKWHKLSKFLLPEYVLNFGYVILGSVVSHTINVTNSGSIPVSFSCSCRNLAGTGFTAEFERVKNLPCGETQTFTVKFDPQGANVKVGDMSVIMPIQVSGGPMVQVRLCAVVTMPAVTVSTETLQFGTVQCGMCQMKTIQLLNDEPVPCCWSIAEEVKPFKKFDKFLPLHKRKKILQEQRPPPPVFEMIPCSGLLSPGERVNINVKFSPTEECAYSRRLVVRVAESTQQVFVAAQGEGEDPQLDFCPSVLELEPCLPLSIETEAEVTVKNPCSFPIEFYSLEYDAQYLSEEKILRLLQGYDENNTLLLPPRIPGEGLPAELLDYYKDHCSALKDDELKAAVDKDETKKNDTQEGIKESKRNDSHPEISALSVRPSEIFVSELTREGSSSRLGQLEMTPICRAIARHMGVDLSPECLAARNRRGIAVIVYGAPLTDKSGAAAALARHYGAAVLSVDAVVTDVLLKCTSPVSLRARQLYEQAAAEHAQKKAEEAAHAAEEAAEPEPAAAPEASDSVDTGEGFAKHTEDSSSKNGSKTHWDTENPHVALCLGDDVTVLRSLLPEQLLVDILAERFQLNDCHRGIVIAGLRSVYTQSAVIALQVVLKALNNRKHIYTVDLSDSYTALKAREKAQREAEYALQKERAAREQQWIQELDEEQFDALSEEQKRSITQRHLETFKQQKLREQMEKELEEKRQQEEIQRLREEDLKKKKKAGKKGQKEVVKKMSLPERKHSSGNINGQKMSLGANSKESLVDAKEHSNSNEVHSGKEADESQKQTEEAKTSNAESPQPPTKVEKEKITDAAEIKRQTEDKELNKSKKVTEKDTKEAPEKKSLPGQKESPVSPDGRRMSKDSSVDTKEHRNLNEGASKSHQIKEADQSHEKAEKAKKSPQPAHKPEGETSAVDKLQSQFSQYEQSQAQMEHILRHWDRTRGLLLVPMPAEDGTAGFDDVLVEKPSPAGKRSKRINSKVAPSPLPCQIAAAVDTAGENLSLPDAIPHIVLNATEKVCVSVAELLKGSTLPPLDEVLDDLGLGPSGPPVPPPTTFSIVTFPKHREQSTVQQTCFTFLVPSGPDKQDEEKKASEDTQTPVMKSDATATPRSRNKGNIKESAPPKDKDKKGRESQRSKRLTSAKTKSKGSDWPRSPSRAASTSDQDQHQGDLELKRSQSLTTFRWVVPAGDEVVLKIWFYSDSPGKFEQTFSFELLGTQRRYQLTCRGVCTYPSICKEYTTLFALTKKVPHVKEGLQKTYVIKPGYFEFGPLLCSKSRDRYKENRYPENMEKLMIHNNSGLEAEVQFCFQHDTQATTYLLDPPSMTLKPDQKQELTVWAYPTKVGQVKDSVVCTIKDNPEAEVIELSCWGVRPELELEKKQLQFERILLYRTDRRSVTMHNRTALPVSWRLQGVEDLGDEFCVPQDHGIIEPNSSFPLSLQFSPRKPLHVKKMLRLEVSDVGKIVGVVHTENIQVTAEAYDVALEITPTDGHLDFGITKVFEEVKLSLKLKNLGKYEIGYKFDLDQIDPSQPKLGSIFTVSPPSGTIGHNEKSTIVQVVCRPNKELSITEQPILPCQVIEPKIGKGGETIVTLNIKVSIQAVFSRYTISPAYDVNFGPVAFGSQKRQSFTIENTGIFDLHYTLRNLTADRSLIMRPSFRGPCKVTNPESVSGRPDSAGARTRRRSVQREQNFLQNRLVLEVFSVYPCTGTLQPGSQQQVTVECAAEQLGSRNQGMLIDISGRDPSDHPDGIPYRLLVDVCKPGIVSDVASIFEEHHLCHSSSQLSSEQFCNAECVYVLEEKKFIFNKVLVGQTTRARFKFTNNRKVPCVLSLAIKYAGAKTSRSMEVFDLSAAVLHIPSQSPAFAEVSFTPHAMQRYNATLEVTIEGASIWTQLLSNVHPDASRMTPTAKGIVLEFKVTGEGTLPSVCVVRPALRSCHGNPMLQFRRVLVGRRHTLPLVLLNDGNIPAQVQIEMLDKHGVFTLKAAPGNTCSSAQIDSITASEESSPSQLMHRAVLRLNVNESAGFEVCFCSDKPLSVKAQMSLQVKDNQYSDTTIQVTGEAYQELVTIDNIKRLLDKMGQEEDEEENYEVLNFGDCHVDWPYQESFTLINHSSSQVARFEWPPPGPQIVFSPQVGHLHAGCSKEVTVTFRSSQPLTLSRQSARCKICQVEFQQPLEQVADWDDRKRTVQWLSSPKQPSDGSQQPVKNKVIKTDPEPSCSVVDGSQRELDLRISAVCDYVKFSCNTDSIHFKDTMLYQTRLHQMQIFNEGNVQVDFSWQVFLDPDSSIVNCDQRGGTSTPRPGSRSAGSRTGSRPPSALARVMSVVTGNLEVPPLSVEPNIGVIEPGATQDFSVCFSPLEVAQFQGKLLCSIPNLQDGVQAPSISVCGRSLLPQCHFDLEDSDYISGNRRNPEFKSSLDPNTRILELNAVGVSAPTSRCFSVVNPTSKSYSFQWRCEDTAGSLFHCLTPCGTIQSGKKVQMCFEYVAEQLDVMESLWSFVIESLSVSVPFLCVGTTREPLVYLDRPHLDFGELHVGHKAEQTVDVVNGEEEPFNFTVLQSSLLYEDQQSHLNVQPMTGTVAPKDRLPLSVSFTPSSEGNVNFRLVVRVKRKPKPLALTVKADSFTMSASVQVQDPDGELRQIIPNHLHALDFGKVGISEQSAFNFLVSNQARFTMEVNFDLAGPAELLQHLEAKPQNATIEVGKQLQSALLFCPLKICNLHDIRLNIKVKFGSTFTFAIKGRAVTPSIDFSFTKFNFGKCFLYRPGMVPPSRTLVISNKGKRDISIQCQFKNTAVFEMDFQPDVLAPGAAMEVPVTFCPREAHRYHEKLTFILSSSITKQVDISGQGVQMKLELEDPKHKKVKLGSLTLGQKVKKQVVLVNRSSLDISFTMMLNTNTPLDLKDLCVTPAGELKLKSNGGSCNVEIQFSPRQHVLPFTAELQAEFAGLVHPLLTIAGSCQDVEVQLKPDHVSFGAVVQRCQTRKKIFMTNTGDFGARFQWKTESFPAELSIKPAKGYISPGTDVPFDVTFAPVELSNDRRYENLSCLVEGSSSPVTLTVTGSCIAASTNKEVLHFVCPVRSSHTQTLSVVNPTNQRCSIKPVIEGEQWRASPFVTLEPHQNKTLEITYHPMTMTADEKKHLGSVFLSFPDGTGTLYTLQGTADPPKAEDTMTHELPAKTQHTELLPVHNWLSRQQRFCVLLETVKPDKPDPTVSLTGLKYIDVPALSRRDYEMSFFTYKEGQYCTKVTFCNELTGEYLFYLVTFKATSPGVLSTIELSSTVRRAVSATVEVENPLTTPASFTTECKSLDISVPSQHTVSGQSKSVLSFDYQPLQAGESTARLTLSSSDLGLFHYDLLLRALPPPAEKTVHFNTSLGSSDTVLVKFINYYRFKTDYTCTTDCPEFSVDKSVRESPGFRKGSETSVEVCFEPHQLGEVRGQLSLSSAVGGEYIFPLHGICLPPKAQGPLSIKSGRSVSIPFKNVFPQTTAFSFQVDNPCFTVKGSGSLPSKKTQNIVVSFEVPPGGSLGPWFGRLSISSQRSEGHHKPCSWIYYLKGYRPESG